MSSAIQQAINEAVKDAMRAKAKERLSTLRLITAEFKRIEVDERIELDDARVLAVLDKMVKQRRESAKQYNDNGRPELAEQELFEISVIQEYLPQQLSEEEIRALVQEAATGLGVSGMADMGLVSQIVKGQLQ